MSSGIADCGEIQLAYETFGSEKNQTVLLIMGLGTQMLAWNESFCTALADRGFWVIRFDNRDIGMSTHLTDAGVPGFGGGSSSGVPYLLKDMADDSAGLMDALGVLWTPSASRKPIS